MYHETLKTIKDIYYTETAEPVHSETPVNEVVDTVFKKAVEIYEPQKESKLVRMTIVTDIYNQSWFDQQKERNKWYDVPNINIGNKTADAVRKILAQKFQEYLAQSQKTAVVQIFNSETVGGFFIEIK